MRLIQTVYFDKPGPHKAIVPPGTIRATCYVRPGDAVSSGEVQISFWGNPIQPEKKP